MDLSQLTMNYHTAHDFGITSHAKQVSGLKLLCGFRFFI